MGRPLWHWNISLEIFKLVSYRPRPKVSRNHEKNLRTTFSAVGFSSKRFIKFSRIEIGQIGLDLFL